MPRGGAPPYPARPGVSPRSSTRQGFRPDRPHTRGFAPPGFRPGLWSTGPTARPGTGERPVGAPDHSPGRNPWAVKPQGETLGGETPRRLRKPRGKCRETCAACANPAANAERLAPLAQTPRQTPRDLRDSRKRHGKCRETCGNSRKPRGKCRETCGNSRERHGKCRETCGNSRKHP